MEIVDPQSGTFESYDPLTIYIRVCEYLPNVEYDFTDMTAFPFVVVPIQTNLTIK